MTECFMLLMASKRNVDVDGPRSGVGINHILLVIVSIHR